MNIIIVIFLRLSIYFYFFFVVTGGYFRVPKILGMVVAGILQTACAP